MDHGGVGGPGDGGAVGGAGAHVEGAGLDNQEAANGHRRPRGGDASDKGDQDPAVHFSV